MMLQEGSDPSADVVTKVQASQLRKYRQLLRKHMFKWNASDVKPTDVIRSSFELTLTNNWKDLAYIMLEVSKLPMYDAIKVRVGSRRPNEGIKCVSTSNA